MHDLEAAIAYYREAFGADVDHREVVECDGVEEALLKVAESYVQLLTPTRPDSPVAKALEKRGEGLHHVGYRVADCAAALDAVMAAGGRAIDEAPRPGSAGHDGRVRPPQGHLRHAHRARPGVGSSVEAAGLVELRRARRRKRLADIHWVDALYHVYLTALLSGMALLLLANAVGDDRASAAGLTECVRTAPAFIGVVVALAVAVGLRSGSRGGPLALERADVRHVLLAPSTAPRRCGARPSARCASGCSSARSCGALAGHLASHRLPGSGASWMASGAAFGLTVAALSYGAALVASALRLRSWVATARVARPPRVGGRRRRRGGRFLADSCRRHDRPVAAGMVARRRGGDGRRRRHARRRHRPPGSDVVEAAERRSILVGQLRFAATLQDIRTVIVLRRQLAMELPRLSPWIRSQPHGHRPLPGTGAGHAQPG